MSMIDNKILDSFFRLRGTAAAVGDQVKVIAIDENAIAKYGRWPWSRVTLARLIDSLVQSGCSVIALDILFPEPEELIDKEILDSLPETSEADNSSVTSNIHALVGNTLPDELFAQSLKTADSSILGLFFFDTSATSDIPESAMQSEPTKTLLSHRIIQVFEDDQSPPDDIFFAPTGYSATTDILAKNVTGEGFLNITPDIDGVIRRAPLVGKYKGEYYPSFALEIVSEFTGNPVKMILDTAGIESISVGDITPPVGLSGSMLINYAGPAKTFPYISAVGLMDTPRDDLSGKIAIVGLTATGLYDIRTTPFGALYPGIEIHANIIDALLNSRYLINPWWRDLAVYLGCVLAAIILILLLPRLKALYGFICSVVLFVAIIGASLAMFLKAHIWYPPLYPLLAVAIIYLAITLIKFIREEQQKRFIKGAFSQYISPQFVDQLVDKPELLQLGGEEKVLTVLFSDIVGFTSISERLSPSRLVELLNNYTTEMSDIVMAHGGTIDKYNGDSIMAFFGAPIYFADHATKACQAAIAMINRINELQDEWKRAGAPPFFTRIGINTGKMIVGNMGSRNKFNYTVLGDAVNLASRLEGANKFYKTQIIIGDQTYRRLDKKVVTRELDSVKVVGKKRPERIFQVIPHATRRYRTFLKQYHKGRHKMRRKDFQGAVDAFLDALKIYKKDAPAQLHLHRCKGFIKNPPNKNWDGSYELQSK